MANCSNFPCNLIVSACSSSSGSSINTGNSCCGSPPATLHMTVVFREVSSGIVIFIINTILTYHSSDHRWHPTPGDFPSANAGNLYCCDGEWWLSCSTSIFDCPANASQNVPESSATCSPFDVVIGCAGPCAGCLLGGVINWSWVATITV